MSEEDKDVKPQEDDTSITPSGDKTTKQTDGKTPDINEQLKSLEEKLFKVEEIASNSMKAMKSERKKRQDAQKELEELRNTKDTKKDDDDDEEEDLTKTYDPGQITAFKEAAKAVGLVTKTDLAKAETARQEQVVQEKNQKVYQEFLSSNAQLFGKADDSSDEQDENWVTFTKFLDDVFDINKGNILQTKNLNKKLTTAMKILAGDANKDDIRRKAFDEAIAKQGNADLLSIGSGSGKGSTSKEENWSRKTPKSEALQHLIRSGFSEKEAKDMVENDPRSK